MSLLSFQKTRKMETVRMLALQITPTLNPKPQYLNICTTSGLQTNVDSNIIHVNDTP